METWDPSSSYISSLHVAPRVTLMLSVSALAAAKDFSKVSGLPWSLMTKSGSGFKEYSQGIALTLLDFPL